MPPEDTDCWDPAEVGGGTLATEVMPPRFKERGVEDENERDGNERQEDHQRSGKSHGARAHLLKEQPHIAAVGREEGVRDGLVLEGEKVDESCNREE